jgi:gluconate 5-dehydrogenase
MLFDIRNKYAVVTGASSGLGVQFATALAREGANVALLARRTDKLDAVKAELEALGVRAIAVKCDVLDNANIASAIAEVKTAFGRIDILVNNAGTAAAAPAESQSDDDWFRVINTNLNSVYFVSREVGKVMIEQKYGKIINIGSIHSNVAMPGLPISGYAAAKGGVRMLTKDLANEWAKHNITVNAIGPSYFESEMTAGVIGTDSFNQALKLYCPMGRLGKSGELDGALLYFASDASSFTTGQLLSVDGGWTSI